MQGVNFPIREQRGDDGVEVFLVPGPDQVREKMMTLNTEGAKALGARMGATPSRATLSRWRCDGYPVDRNGPRVILPSITTLKKVKTSAPALGRFLEVVSSLGAEIRAAGGVRRWREQRTKE